ncbi:MAG: Ig-like domain-containing protein [Nocardioides sp.]
MAVTATRAKLTKQQAKRAQAGKRFTVKIKVASDTATPTGKVRVRIKGKGAPTKARKGLVKTLTNGKVKVKFPALPKGKYKIKTIYLGTDAFAASTAKLIKVRVR